MMGSGHKSAGLMVMAIVGGAVAVVGATIPYSLGLIIGALSDKVWFWNGRRRPFILIGGVLAALMLLTPATPGRVRRVEASPVAAVGMFRLNRKYQVSWSPMKPAAWVQR